MNQFNRTQRNGAAASDVGASNVPFVLARDRRTTIRLTVAEAVALGISTQELALPAAGPIAATYTGRVIAAPGTREIVQAPADGLVTHLYVKVLQPVRAGSPLLRLSVSNVGEIGQEQKALGAALQPGNASSETGRRRRSPVAPDAAQRRSESAAQSSTVMVNRRASGKSPSAIPADGESELPRDSISVTATIAATVTSVNVSSGTRVPAGTALLQLSKFDALAVEIQLPASAAAHWSLGAEVNLIDSQATARIAGIKRARTTKSRVVLVYAEIESLRELEPTPVLGELVRVTLSSATVSQWQVPASAVARIASQAYVFVQSADGFEAIAVVAMPGVGGLVRISGRMQAAQQIAVSGVTAIVLAWLGATAGCEVRRDDPHPSVPPE